MAKVSQKCSLPLYKKKDSLLPLNHATKTFYTSFVKSYFVTEKIKHHLLTKLLVVFSPLILLIPENVNVVYYLKV